MPWVIDRNSGEKRYQVSLYTKEELPTWTEVYRDWFNAKKYYYDPSNDDHQELDKYWNVPRLKYLHAVICNQFNKTLFEDNKKEELLKYLNTEEVRSIMNMEAIDVRFVIEDIYDMKDIFMGVPDIEGYNKWISERNKKYFIGEESTPPPIYTIPLPTGKDNPFITNDHPRININTIDDMVSIVPIILYRTIDWEVNGHIAYDCNITKVYHDHPEAHECRRNMWIKVITFMMKQYVNYFKEPIGWKDSEGKLIELDEVEPTSCSGVGYDPAL